jgi:FixJ family two-component response regulator
MSEVSCRNHVYVVDDDPDLGASVARLLRRMGYSAEPFLNPKDLLSMYKEGPAACVVTDVMMGDMDGFAFAEALRAIDPHVAMVFMTAWPATSKAVDAIRVYGGIDYLEKPIDHDRLAAAIEEGIRWSAARRGKVERLSKLTKRENEVFGLLVKGFSTKEIARELGLSPRTIEDHRAQISSKTGTSSLRELVALTELS